MRHFASTLVKFSKLSYICAPPLVAGPFVTPLQDPKLMTLDCSIKAVQNNVY